MAYCHNCGAQVPDSNVFCNNCGAPIIHKKTDNYYQNSQNQQTYQPQTQQQYTGYQQQQQYQNQYNQPQYQQSQYSQQQYQQTNVQQSYNYVDAYNNTYGDSFREKTRNPKYNPDLSGFEIFKIAFADFKENHLFWRTFGATLVFSLITTLLSLLGFIPVIGAILSLIISFTVSPMLTVGYFRYLINALRGKGKVFEDLFYPLSNTSFGHWFSVGWRNMLIGLAIIAASILFVIPGIIVAYRYAMFLPMVADNPEGDIKEIYNKAVKAMKGKKGKLFVTMLTPGLIMCIPVILITFIVQLIDSIAISVILGIIIYVMMMYISMITSYCMPEFYLTQIKEFE